ncbi:hypothetical protein [Duffyella gerundensis]|uniref:hypothetical protein n=1 Tax=Duffyella TaxID=3026546 RepID=UPI003F6DBE51
MITWNPAIARTVNAPLLTATAIDHLAITDVKRVGTLDQRPDSQDLRTDQIGLFFNCAGDPTAGEKTGCNDITLNNVEVENSSDGIHIKGASHLRATDLKLHNNGNTQKDYFHNIYLRRVADVRLRAAVDESRQHLFAAAGYQHDMFAERFLPLERECA